MRYVCIACTSDHHTACIAKAGSMSCDCPCVQPRAEQAYPDHAPSTALANYRAGREVWDTNGDLR